MANLLFDTGKEFLAKYVFEESVDKPSSVDVGLYHESDDNLSETDDIDDITTEPNGSNYSRQSVDFGSTDWSTEFSDGDWDAFFDEITFDLSDSDNTVDSYFVVINFEADGDDSANDHLFFSSDLSQEYELNNLDQLDGSEGGVTITNA